MFCKLKIKIGESKFLSQGSLLRIKTTGCISEKKSSLKILILCRLYTIVKIAYLQF